jgi:hypothetical protein
MKFLKLVIILFLLFSFSSCAYLTPNEQQIKIRHTIDSCQTFDCSVLENEIIILKQLIEQNSKYQGVQQSLVTSITKKCMKNIPNDPCQEYLKERKKLKY